MSESESEFVVRIKYVGLHLLAIVGVFAVVVAGASGSSILALGAVYATKIGMEPGLVGVFMAALLVGGAATFAQLSEDRRAIIEAINLSGGMTPTQIASATDPKLNNVNRLVKRMVDDGLIRNLGNGTYGPLEWTNLSESDLA